MAAINQTQQGFIFVNSVGQYAVPAISSGHGPSREVINWVDNINAAHVFPHEAMMRRWFKQLEKAQSLKAVATREVMLVNWGEEPEEDEVPCSFCLHKGCNGECTEGL